MHSPIVSTVEKIDPATATRWLEQNTHNRRIRETVTNRYARDMAAGNWELNGEAIKFSGEGILLDGQQRLTAVVRSGATIESLVIFGLPAEAQASLDQGMKRRTADILGLTGETDPFVAAAAIALAMLYERDGMKAQAKAWPSAVEQARWYHDHPGVHHSVELGIKASKTMVIAGGVSAALHLIIAQKHPTQADEFFNEIITGVGSTVDSPVMAYRAALQLHLKTAPRARANRVFQLALGIKAFNLWRKGETTKRLVWWTGGKIEEDFPKVR